MRNIDHQRRAAKVELGDTPPLTIGDQDPNRYSRRGVSVRWLFGAVVTAVTSLALMGGALVTALDGRYVLEAQAGVSGASIDTASGRSSRASKGDRVKPEYEEVSSRRILQVNTVVRQEERDLIAKRPYALVNASLILDKKTLGDIPTFNARDLAVEPEGPVAATDAIYDKSVDGEITVSVSSFPLDEMMPFVEDLILDDEEIEQQIREDQIVGGDFLSLRAEGDAFVPTSAITPPNVTVVPENMSEIIKTTEDDGDNSAGNELVELVQPGDTLNKIMLGSGVSAQDVKAIDAILQRLGVATLRPGQILRIGFQLDETAENAQRRPSRLSIYAKNAHVATVAMTDDGRFVLGEAPQGPAPQIEDEVSPGGDRLPTIYESLYQTAMNHNLPEDVRDTLLRIFSLDVDFNTRVRPGDGFTVLHSANTEEGEPSEILFASLMTGGVERRFYRFKSEDGGVDFYDEEGRTGDKFLLRKPMERGVFRSGFGMRRHPILKRRRMHKGVDWAAPRGTRIYAAGDGVIKQAGWKAGYGRWVSITHKNGYETGYAHQSRIAKGIRPGTRVKQGQVIGYVGSTGFSTGPHLHYEVRVNGRHVNPLKIRLRRGRELSGDTLDGFKNERDRIDALIGEDIQLASR